MFLLVFFCFALATLYFFDTVWLILALVIYSAVQIFRGKNGDKNYANYRKKTIHNRGSSQKQAHVNTQHHKTNHQRNKRRLNNLSDSVTNNITESTDWFGQPRFSDTWSFPDSPDRQWSLDQTICCGAGGRPELDNECSTAFNDPIGREDSLKDTGKENNQVLINCNAPALQGQIKVKKLKKHQSSLRLTKKKSVKKTRKTQTVSSSACTSTDDQMASNSENITMGNLLTTYSEFTPFGGVDIDAADDMDEQTMEIVYQREQTGDQPTAVSSRCGEQGPAGLQDGSQTLPHGTAPNRGSVKRRPGKAAGENGADAKRNRVSAEMIAEVCSEDAGRDMVDVREGVLVRTDKMVSRISQLVADSKVAIDAGLYEHAKRLALEALVGATDAKDKFVKGVTRNVTDQHIADWFGTCADVLHQCECRMLALTCFYTATVFDPKWTAADHLVVSNVLWKSLFGIQHGFQIQRDYRKIYGMLQDIYGLAKFAEQKHRYMVARFICRDLERTYVTLLRKYGLAPGGIVGIQADPKEVPSVIPVMLCSARCAAAMGERKVVRDTCSAILTSMCDYDNIEALELWGTTLYQEKQFELASKKIECALRLAQDDEDRERLSTFLQDIDAQLRKAEIESNKLDSDWLVGTEALPRKPSSGKPQPKTNMKTKGKENKFGHVNKKQKGHSYSRYKEVVMSPKLPIPSEITKREKRKEAKLKASENERELVNPNIQKLQKVSAMENRAKRSRESSVCSSATTATDISMSAIFDDLWTDVDTDDETYEETSSVHSHDIDVDDADTLQAEETSFYEQSCRVHFSGSDESETLISDQELLRSGVQLNASYLHRFQDKHPNVLERGSFYKPFLGPDQLRECLLKQPDIFKRCVIQIEGSHVAFCTPVVSEDGISTIEISGRSKAGQAFNDDDVVVQLLDTKHEKSDKRYGEVVGVLKRARHSEVAHPVFICTLDDIESHLVRPMCKTLPKIHILNKEIMDHQPKYKKFKVEIYQYDHHNQTLDDPRIIDLTPGDRGKYLFLVAYINWGHRHIYPRGAVIRRLPFGTTIGRGLEILDLQHQVPKLYKKKTVAQVESMTRRNLDEPQMEMLEGRKDLTGLRTFTIDPPGSRDLDDALSIEKHERGYKVGVHIADVTSFISKDDQLDEEAKARAMSFYPGLNGWRTRHMLPEPCSVNLCSLIPDKVRLTLSVFFYLDAQGRPAQIEGNNYEIQKTFIKSNRQFTYREVQNIIEERTQDEEGSDEIRSLFKLARNIRKQRLGNAMFALDLVNEEEPDEDSVMETLEAHYLVEEFMIMANKKVAKFLIGNYRNNVPLRCQPPPSKESMEAFVQNNDVFLDILMRFQDKHICDRKRSVEHLLGTQDVQSCPKVMVSHKLWDRISTADEEASKCLRTDELHPLQHLVYQHWLSIQERASYKCSSSGDGNHFSLDVFPYTHFTSPIRRFCDMVVHRLLHAALANEPCPYSQHEVETICIHVNSVMKRSKDYSKGCRALKQAVDLKERPQMIRCFVDDVSDKNVSISAPELKHVAKIYRELPFNLLDMGFKPDLTPDTVTNQEKVKAKWRKRVYDFRGMSINPADKGRTLTLNSHPGVMFVPVHQWARLLKCAVDSRMKDLKTNVKHTDTFMTNGLDDVSTECLDPTDLQPNTTFELSYTQGQTLNIQMSAEAQKGVLAPRPMLYNMTNNVKCCLQHMDDPVLNLHHYTTRSTQDQYKTTKLYLERWLPLILMEAATGAITNEEGCTITNVPIKFSGDRRGKIVFPLGYCDIRNIEFSGTVDEEDTVDQKEKAVVDTNAYDWLCLKYTNTPQNHRAAGASVSGDTPSTIWVGHAVIYKVERRRDDETGGKVTVHFILHDRAMSPPQDARAKTSRFNVEVLYKAEVDRRTEKFIKCLPHTGEEDPLAVKIALNNAPIPSLDKDRIHAAATLPERDLYIPPGGDIHPLPRNNARQQEAIDRALMSRFSLIQGPPGTGKTYTGIKLICLFDKLNEIMSKESRGDGRKQVLFCGPSNKSVDLVARWMLNRLGHLRPNFVRVYGRSIEALDFPIPGRTFLSKRSIRNMKADDSLKSVALHHIIRQKGKKHAEEINAFDNKFRSLRQNGEHPKPEDVRRYVHLIREASIDEIRKHDVILCTTAVGSNPKILEATKVFQVIVDESGMCPEPHCLVPIIATKAKQVVLIGDHKQLRPIVMCKESAELGMEKSLFERYALTKCSQNVEFTMLEVQYRMNPQLCHFPSKHFYNGQLQTKPGPWREDTMNIWPMQGGTSFPHVLIHVEGEESALTVSTEDGNEQSKSNAIEIEHVVRVFGYLINEGVPDNRINVVSQYNAQCSELKTALSKSFTNFSVNTVVSSQGGEWDYVIFSTVRSLPDYKIEHNPTLGWCKQNLGFITDENQINVALTRARKGLIIIGNEKLLRCDRMWSKLIEHYEKNGCLKTPAEFPPPPRSRQQKMKDAIRKTQQRHGDERFISGKDQVTSYEGPLDDGWQTKTPRKKRDGQAPPPRLQRHN